MTTSFGPNTCVVSFIESVKFYFPLLFIDNFSLFDIIIVINNYYGITPQQTITMTAPKRINKWGPAIWRKTYGHFQLPGK